jgi:hypothetical protein
MSEQRILSKKWPVGVLISTAVVTTFGATGKAQAQVDLNTINLPH